MYIYEIRNTITNVSYYGQSRQKIKQRVWGHRSNLRHGKHSNRYLQRAWNKYGEDAFEFNILFDNVETNELLNELEMKLIQSNPSYNLTSGGENFTHNDLTKQKMRESMLAKISKNPSYKLELITRVNSWRTEESMKLFSEKCRNFWQSDVGKKIHSDTSKRVWSDESRRKKLSISHKERIKNSPDELKRLQQQSKHGAQMATLARQKTYDGFISPDMKVFKSIVNLNEFCRIHNLDSRLMGMVNSGKRKSHKGWTKYAHTQC